MKDKEFKHSVDSLVMCIKGKRMKKRLINVFLLDQKISEREMARFKIYEVSRISEIVLVAGKDIKDLYIVRKDRKRRILLSQRRRLGYIWMMASDARVNGIVSTEVPSRKALLGMSILMIGRLFKKITISLPDAVTPSYEESLYKNRMLRRVYQWLRIAIFKYIVIGSEEEVNRKTIDSRKVIKSHTYDWEEFSSLMRETNDTVTERYGLFIDQAKPYHPDLREDDGYVEGKYYECISRALKKIAQDENVQIRYKDHPRVAADRRKKYLRFETDTSEGNRSTIAELRNSRVVIGHNSTLLLLANHMGKRIYIVNPEFLQRGSREEQDIKLMADVLGAECIESNDTYQMYKKNGGDYGRGGIGVPYLRHPEDTDMTHEDILKKLLLARAIGA